MPKSRCQDCDRLVPIRAVLPKGAAYNAPATWYPLQHTVPVYHANCGGGPATIDDRDQHHCATCGPVPASEVVDQQCFGHEKPI